jgi:hypothetical protein
LLENAAQKTRSEVEDRVRLLRSAVELRIANVIEDLEVLARSPALKNNNLSEFREHAIEVVNVIGAIGIVRPERIKGRALNALGKRRGSEITFSELLHSPPCCGVCVTDAAASRAPDGMF